MNTLSYKTVSANAATVDENWVVVDAEGQTLGRFASKVALLLRGKRKTNYTPHVDCGDNVIIVNADKVVLGGNKMTEKKYIWHTGYPSGQRTTNPENLMAKFPERVLEKAVKGMLPKNRLGADLFRNLHVYAGPDHKNEAQKPTVFNINEFK